MRKTISVVVCTHNRAGYLKSCLRSLLNQSCHVDQIVVVDDASTDSTEEMLDEMLEETGSLKVVRLRKQQGIALARNTGILHSGSEIVAFLDDDSIAEKRWLENILRNYYDERIVGVGGPIIELGKNRKTFGEYPSIKEDGTIVGASFRNCRELKGLRKKSVPHLQGGNMSFRRSVLLQVLGVHKSFSGSAYREETDLSMNAAKFGVLLFVPSAVAFHLSAMFGGTREKASGKIETFMYYKFRNTALLFTMHLPFAEAAKKAAGQATGQVLSIMRGTIDLGTRSYLVMTSPLKTIAAIVLGTIVGLAHGIKQKIFKKEKMALPKSRIVKVKSSLAELKRNRNNSIMDAITFEIARFRNRL